MGPPFSVVGPQHCVPHPLVWTVKEGFSEQRGETEFADAQGKVYLKLAASLKWFTSKRAVLDPSGQPVCCSFWNPAPASASQAYFCAGKVYDKSRQLARIQQRMLATQAHMDVFLRGNDSVHPDVTVQGSFWKRNFLVATSSKRPLIQISHDKVPSNSFFTDTSNAYRVVIQPEVDIAFTALLLCYIDDTIRCITYSLAAGGAAGSTPY